MKSELPRRRLSELAAVLRETAVRHRAVADLIEREVSQIIAEKMRRLADEVEETAEQIERGDYGRP